MFGKSIDEISGDDLTAVVRDRRQESQTLDYKSALPGRDNSARHEFLADVCAFANSSGGDLLYGIAEDGEGCANAIQGISVNVDEEQLRLQNVILDGLEPRLTGVQVRGIPVTNGHVFVVRIPKSWAAPHRVRTNQHFFIRESTRKRQLDVPEIRKAFLRTESQAERMRDFRASRIGNVLTGETPIPLLQGTIGVLHIVPLQPADGSLPVDPMLYQQERLLPVVSGGLGGNFRVNLDGAVVHRNVTENGCRAYTLLFRNGMVEAVRVFTVTSQANGAINIPSTTYENEILEFFSAMQTELVRLRLGPPLAIMYSLLRAKNARLDVADAFGLDEHHGRFDRDTLLYPEVVNVEQEDPGNLLRPLFDMVWQSVGFPASGNYDVNGRWQGR